VVSQPAGAKTDLQLEKAVQVLLEKIGQAPKQAA
jgi:hypothetical protein